MEDQIVRSIETLSNKLGIAANEIVPHYASYFVIQSAAYVGLGIVLVIIAMKLLRAWRKFTDKGEPSAIVSIIGMVILFALGSLFITVNIADMIKPQAAAYHQLIKDLQPLKR